jgi:folate-binding protein YgfZ
MLPTKSPNKIATLRDRGGYFDALEFGLIEVYGKDAARFLQSQTTNDVKSLSACCGQLSSLLDRKAHVKAIFDLYRRHESFRIIAEKSQIPAILAHLDEYRFADKVEFLDLTNTGQFFAIEGPEAPVLVRRGEQNSKHPNTCDHDLTDAMLWALPVHIFRKSLTGENGYFIWVSKSQSDEFKKHAESACQKSGLVALDAETLEVARIEAGRLKYGVDIGEENLLPETGLEELAASYTKGCFLGQEVLARVKAHGAPSRAIVGLSFETGVEEVLQPESKLLVNGEEVAIIKSNVFSTLLNRTIAIAFVKRDYRIVGKVIDGQLGGRAVKVTVSFLPFYHAETTSARALRLYAKGLDLYAKETDESAVSESIKLLRDALALDPTMENAYEALGVILSKRGDLNEAIQLMKRLCEINPDSIMAHTNLSVFYIEQGLKEEAEEEKAISMSIRMRLAAQQVTSAKEQEEAKTAALNATKERMEMFKQVLAIDSEDLLANYGYGSCLTDLGEPEKAIPFLEKAIAIKPTHTVAYLSLARAYKALANAEKLAQTIEKGIEVASKRGDLSPLNEMEKMKYAAQS